MNTDGPATGIPATQAGRCQATREGLKPGSVRQCPRRAAYGQWCFQHAHSVGGWVLVPPDRLASHDALEDRVRQLDAAIALEIHRLWQIAYKHNDVGPGTVGLLVDMTNAIGGLDSLRVLLATVRETQNGGEK